MKRLLLPLLALAACHAASENTPNTQRSQDLLPEWTFTKGIEGPAVDAHGLLYAVNHGQEGTIGVVTPEGEASTYLTLPEGSTGNGIRFGADGTMYIADYSAHHILRVPPGSQQAEKWVHGPHMNQPNDIAIAPNGVLYASDPNWAESTGKLWQVSPQGQLTLLEANMGTTNGVEVSPDGTRLYVNESNQRKLWVYDIEPGGGLANKRLMASFEDHKLDGMRCDVAGNLYVTRHGKGQVLVFTPGGKLLQTVTLKGKEPSNLAFGGADGQTVYVTMADRGCFETFRALKPGRAWAAARQ